MLHHPVDHAVVAGLGGGEGDRLGGALLLTHSHAIANVKDQLLIELTHTPLALAGICGGWARWLEIRADGPIRRAAGWIWPVCFMFVGLLLLLYREA